MQRDDFLRIAQDYWTLRKRGTLSDERSQAHNTLLDAMNECGISYEDREHAAMLAREMLDAPERFDALSRLTLEVGMFLHLGWYVGRVTDVSRSGAAFELESPSFLASRTLSRKWLLTAQQKRLTPITQAEAIAYARQEDMRGVASLIHDQEALREQWEAQAVIDAPFPATGQFLHCVDWFGLILGVAREVDRTFLMVESAKMLSRRGAKYETLEVKPTDTIITQATQADALTDISRYIQIVAARITEAEGILTSWQHS